MKTTPKCGRMWPPERHDGRVQTCKHTPVVGEITLAEGSSVPLCAECFSDSSATEDTEISLASIARRLRVAR